MIAKLKLIVDQWDQHDRFRDFESWGEPAEVQLARSMLKVLPLLAECAEQLSECAVEIANAYGPENIVLVRARATMRAVQELLERWNKQEANRG